MEFFDWLWYPFFAFRQQFTPVEQIDLDCPVTFSIDLDCPVTQVLELLCPVVTEITLEAGVIP